MSVENPKNLPMVITLLVAILLLILLIFAQNFADENKTLIVALISSGYFLFLSVRYHLFFPKTFTILYLVFLSFNLFSLFNSPSVYNSLLRFIELSSFLFLITLTYNLFQKEGARKIFSGFLVTFAFLISIITLYHYQNQAFNFLPSHSAQWPFKWPGILAGFLFLILPISLGGLFSEKNKLLLIIKFLFAIFIIAALLLTKSSWVIITLIPLLILMVFFLFGEIRKKVSLIIGLLFVIFTLIYPFSQQYFTVQPNLQTILFQGDFACRDENDLRRAGLTMFRDHPILGNGPASFAMLYPTYQEESWARSKYAFNEYLQVLTENGILGLLSFLLIPAYLFYLFIKIGWERGYLTKAAFLSIFGFLFYNLNDFSARVLSLETLFWIIVGFYLTQIKSNEGQADKNRSLKFLALVLFLASSFLTITVSQFRQAQNYLFKEDRPQEAEVILSRLTKIFPFNPNFFTLQATINVGKGEETEAIENLKKAQILEPKNAEILYHLGYIYQKTGKNSQAEDYLKRAIEMTPFSSPPAYYNTLIQVYFDQGKKDEALKLAQKATEEIFPLNSKFDFCQRYLSEQGVITQLITTYTWLETLKKDGEVKSN